MKIKLLQILADFIVERIKLSNTLKGVIFWFNLGMMINANLVEKNIYLN